MIAAAKSFELGAWDHEVLRSDLRFFSELNFKFDFSVLGFDTAEVDCILASAITEPGAEPSPHAGRPAISAPGDLWQAGRHFISCGDPLDPGSYERLLGRARARLVIVDPPHRLHLRGHEADADRRDRQGAAVCDTTDPIARSPLATALKNFAAYSLDGSLHYIGTDWEHYGETRGAGRAVFSELVDTCVWCRPHPGKGSLYRSGHSLILVFKSGAAPPRQHQRRLARPQPFQRLVVSQCRAPAPRS